MTFKASRRPSTFPGRQHVVYRRKLLARMFNDLKRCIGRNVASKPPKPASLNERVSQTTSVIEVKTDALPIENGNTQDPGPLEEEQKQRERDASLVESQPDDDLRKELDELPSSPEVRERSTRETADTAAVNKFATKGLEIPTADQVELSPKKQGEASSLEGCTGSLERDAGLLEGDAGSLERDASSLEGGAGSLEGGAGSLERNAVVACEAQTSDELFYDQATGLIESLRTPRPVEYSYDSMNDMRSQVETMLAEWEYLSKSGTTSFGNI